MRGRVPARTRQIEAADEREPVVDHDELLMMRRAARMRIVEPEHDPAMRAPARAIDGRPVALERVDHREVPREHVDPQVVPARRERVQERRERIGEAVVGAARHEPHPAVDVPAEDEHRMARTQERGPQCREIRVAVDQRREAVRMTNRVAVAADLEQAVPDDRVARCGAALRVVGARRAGRREAGARAAGRHDHRASTSRSPSMRCSSTSQRARSACISGECASRRTRSPSAGWPCAVATS
ncbi:hypothetical protein FEP58_06048 [Burkholderia multivorans]|nr:hypothetical protein [Burkholderia multivorans]